MTVWTVKETAELLRVSELHIRRMITRGQLRALKVGRAWRVPADAIEQLSTSPGCTPRD